MQIRPKRMVIDFENIDPVISLDRQKIENHLKHTKYATYVTTGSVKKLYLF